LSSWLSRHLVQFRWFFHRSPLCLIGLGLSSPWHTPPKSTVKGLQAKRNWKLGGGKLRLWLLKKREGYLVRKWASVPLSAFQTSWHWQSGREKWNSGTIHVLIINYPNTTKTNTSYPTSIS
jgi:hypothetical protein